MDLDRVAFTGAFERVRQRLHAATLVQRRHRELPSTIEELVESNVADTANDGFFTLLVLREMTPTPNRVRLDEVAITRSSERFTFFAGDLEVAGNFTFEHPVLVQGDLIVGGVLEDRSGASPLFVGGNVRARGVSVGSPTKIGGTLTADIMHVRPGGRMVVRKGATTKLSIPASTCFIGTHITRHAVDAKPARRDPALRALRNDLATTLAWRLDVEAPDMTLLVEAVRDGVTLWR